jgi:hypothetical protein
LEGNRSRTDIPTEVELHGTPSLDFVDKTAAGHFHFLAAEFGGCGVLKRADAPALAALADLWELYWTLRAGDDIDTSLKVKARWDSAASKLGLQVIDRSKLITGQTKSVDPIRSKFLKVTG